MCMCVCVCACICVHAPEAINNYMKRSMNNQLNKLHCILVNRGRSRSNETHLELLSKIANYKVRL